MPSDAENHPTVDSVDTNAKTNSSRGHRGPRLTSEEILKRHEEEQAQKKVLETGITGKVKWYSVQKKYGFIARDDGKSDIFVHLMNITNSTTEKYFLRSLANDEEVVFDVVEGKNGPEAANVSGPNGKPVIGANFRYVYRVVIGHRFDKGTRKSTKTEEGNSDEATSKPKSNRSKPKRRLNRRARNTSVKTDATQDSNAENNDAAEPKTPKADNVKSAKPKKTPRKHNKKPVAAGDASTIQSEEEATKPQDNDVNDLVTAVGSIQVAN